ncbi:hypothetical protein BpHYR1_009955 [Brachionus plicatilis]|uniref:Uncharacterized protein n=1 Tax=Brachionus plicatilis TaxID=10195 RepID=A0A3M7QIQ8_BRAPC|nr:hypothetical protein BpHYR1_009955 [Brachionus plicatilis]
MDMINLSTILNAFFFYMLFHNQSSRALGPKRFVSGDRAMVVEVNGFFKLIFSKLHYMLLFFYVVGHFNLKFNTFGVSHDKNGFSLERELMIKFIEHSICGYLVQTIVILNYIGRQLTSSAKIFTLKE